MQRVWEVMEGFALSGALVEARGKPACLAGVLRASESRFPAWGVDMRGCGAVPPLTALRSR